LVGKDGFNLSYESLTSEEAKKALSEQMKNSKGFADTLSQLEPIGTEDDDEVTDNHSGGTVEEDEIDSSKTLSEEIVDLMAAGMADGPSDGDEVCVGTNLEQYIGYEFSSRTATNAWMQWNSKGSY
jgi:hypothetical protein